MTNHYPNLCLPGFGPREYIYLLDLDFDIDAQLEAIHGLLCRNRRAKQALEEEIRLADERARKLQKVLSERAVNEYISLACSSVYQDAAHSMAAVGMLAPFVETIFTRCFLGIGRMLPQSASSASGHERWQAAGVMQWDCHNVFKEGRVQKDLVRGILQLVDAIGIQHSLPSDLSKTLNALFGYRNKMFHCGYEWPVEERTAFQRRISEEGWPSCWFEKATADGEPWVFYLTDEFITHCLETAEAVLTAFGEYVFRNFSAARNATTRFPSVPSD